MSTPLIIYSQYDKQDNTIYFECINPSWHTKYYFFAETADSPNVYAIKTNWVVYHDNLIKNALLDSGVHLFDSNPLDRCNYIQNRDYDWKKDTVLYKGNKTDRLNVIAYDATKVSFSIEWVLIFSWIWVPFGILLIDAIYETIRDKRNKRLPLATPLNLEIVTPK